MKIISSNIETNKKLINTFLLFNNLYKDGMIILKKETITIYVRLSYLIVSSSFDAKMFDLYELEEEINLYFDTGNLHKIFNNINEKSILEISTKKTENDAILYLNSKQKENKSIRDYEVSLLGEFEMATRKTILSYDNSIDIDTLTLKNTVDDIIIDKKNGIIFNVSKSFLEIKNDEQITKSSIKLTQLACLINCNKESSTKINKEFISKILSKLNSITENIKLELSNDMPPRLSFESKNYNFEAIIAPMVDINDD